VGIVKGKGAGDLGTEASPPGQEKGVLIMHIMFDEFLGQARQEALLQQAAHERLLRAAAPEQMRYPGFYRAGAHWLGLHLIRWGYKLERAGRVQHARPSST
jgi:hypothetical protein